MHWGIIRSPSYQMFCWKIKLPDPERIPPTRDSLILYLKRANYVTRTCRQAFIRYP